jgi:DMSO/TMAO reductase YedYZ molybdopterin-dependent catalytic subunit
MLSLICAVVLMSRSARRTCASFTFTLTPPTESAAFSRCAIQRAAALEAPFSLSYAELLALPQTELAVDVHCVTGWSVMGAKVKGVLLSELAARAKVKSSARHVVFEGAHGYTSNVPLREALGPQVMVARELEGAALPRTHGGPLRAMVPHLYFWKSAKWLTGIRFVARDEPGYWETRGYHNHADPWREERYG